MDSKLGFIDPGLGRALDFWYRVSFFSKNRSRHALIDADRGSTV